jgi:hypothetical protein
VLSVSLSPDHFTTVLEPLWGDQYVQMSLQAFSFARELVAFDTFFPNWLAHGLPPILGSFRRTGQQVRWAGPQRAGAGWVSEKSLVSLDRLLRLAPHDPDMRKREFADRFDSTSILFTHFLLFGDHSLEPGGLARYLRAQHETGDPAKSLELAFGSSVSELETAFRKAFRENTLKRVSFPAIDFPAPTFTVAPEAEVETTLARVALSAGQAVTARRHINRLRALRSPDVLLAELDGHLAWCEKDYPRMAASFTEARRLGSEDAGVLHGLARAALSRTDKIPPLAFEASAPDRSPPDPASARQAADFLHEAIRRRPQWPVSYRVLAGLIAYLPEVGQPDKTSLIEGLKRFPDHPELHFGLAWAEKRAGHLTQAVAHMRFAADLADVLAYKDVAPVARSHANEWDLDLGLATLRDALQRRDHATAAIIIKQLEATPGLSPSQTRELRELQSPSSPPPK